jgi:hypothetical protein
MCITMINPATSWFEISELLISQPSELDIPMGTNGHKGKDKHIQQKQMYFDKSSATVSTLVNRTWFIRYPCSQYMIYDNGSEFKLTSRPFLIQTVWSVSQSESNILKRMQYLRVCIKQSWRCSAHLN